MAKHKIGFYDKNNKKYFLALVPINSMIRKSIFPSSSRRGVLTGPWPFPQHY